MNPLPTSFLSSAHERLRTAAGLWTFYALVVLLAYGFTMFNLVLVSDDWVALQANFQSDLVISVGRWMDAIIWYLTSDDSFAPALTLGVLALAYGIFAMACCICLDLKRRESYLIFACMLICFPFNAEPFVFKNMHLVFAFAMTMATVSGLLIVRSHELLIGERTLKAAALGAGAAIAFVVSAAAYQTHALLAAALVLARSVGMMRETEANPRLLRSIASLFGLSAMVFGFGYLLYMASVHAASSLTEIPLATQGKYAVVGSFAESWHELFHQVHRGLDFLSDLFFSTQHLFPLATKLAFLLVTAAAMMLFAFGLDGANSADHPRRTLTRDGSAKAVILAGIVVLLFLAPLTLGMLRKITAYRYDGLIGIAVPYAMVFALLFDMLRETRWRSAAAALTVVIIATFIFEQNRASITSFLLNRRDLAVAGQMLERITANPAFAPFAAKGQATILFYGERLEHRTLPRPFSIDGLQPRSMNDCGPFNCQPWRIAPAFWLISAGGVTYRADVWPALTADLPQEEKDVLEQRIQQAHPWPAPDAVIFGTNVIVVMLRPAKHP